MGAEKMDLPGEGITVDGLFALLLAREPARTEHGFTKFNTIVVVNGGEAFSASSQGNRKLNEGDEVVLVPFSHGG
jgi:molybdopterin converting factor small subunit